ncbi:MAG TPA: potassium channel family protein, partial [Acidimicrobiales bacterium]|nr:potassium channel family protein [Acidimicrobiales bacterium]
MGAGSVALLVGGLALVVLMIVDLAATLVVTWGSAGAWRPTRRFYRRSWRLWSRAGRRMGNVDHQQRFLATYAPLSLLALLFMWLTGLLLGWTLVWLALRDQVTGVDDFGSALYYSGVVLLTVGFGDVTAEGLGARLLSITEAGTGLTSIALVISYLPALYGAYGRRETRLLTLDVPSGERITPTGLVVSQSPGQDLDALYRFFEHWELWMAEVLESHTTYPMLAFFRSQHRGQSWITALGVVLDAAVICTAVIPGAEIRSPFFLYRRGRQAVDEIHRRLDPPVVTDTFLDERAFGYAYRLIVDAGLPHRPQEEAWARMQELRPTYGDQLQGLFDYLVAPPGFWGHGAGDELPEPEIPAEAGVPPRGDG